MRHGILELHNAGAPCRFHGAQRLRVQAQSFDPWLCGFSFCGGPPGQVLKRPNDSPKGLLERFKPGAQAVAVAPHAVIS